MAIMWIIIMEMVNKLAEDRCIKDNNHISNSMDQEVILISFVLLVIEDLPILGNMLKTNVKHVIRKQKSIQMMITIHSN